MGKSQLKKQNSFSSMSFFICPVFAFFILTLYEIKKSPKSFCSFIFFLFDEPFDLYFFFVLLSIGSR